MATGAWKKGADLPARLVAHGARGVRVRRLGGDRASEIRITRFLRNPSVTLEEMIGTAFGRTEAACAGRDVLAVQDTTVTRASAGGRGSFLHATIAVDAATGAVLGALDAQFPERSEGGRASRRQRGAADRQSIRWLLATRRAAALRGAARVTVVADREADIFELFAHRLSPGRCRPRGARHARPGARGRRQLAAAIAGEPCPAMPRSRCPPVPAWRRAPPGCRSASAGSSSSRRRRTAGPAPGPILGRSRWPMSTSTRKPRQTLEATVKATARGRCTGGC